MEGISEAKKTLLSVQQVAEYLGVGPVTVYRWCREGRLPCLKVGKHWRIRCEALEDFLRRGERPVTLVGQLRWFLQVSDSVLGISQDLDLLYRLDGAFFQVGEVRDGLLVKFYDREQESSGDLRAELERHGLNVTRLEDEGRLRFAAESNPVSGRVDALRQLLDKEADNGRTVWASFNWLEQADLEAALRQQNALGKLIEDTSLVVKTPLLERVLDEWPRATERQAQALHSNSTAGGWKIQISQGS